MPRPDFAGRKPVIPQPGSPLGILHGQTAPFGSTNYPEGDIAMREITAEQAYLFVHKTILGHS
jgi:hypothetical protein